MKRLSQRVNGSYPHQTAKSQKINSKINKYLSAKNYSVKQLNLTVGAGSSYQDILDLKSSYLEAQKVIMARQRDLLVNDCISYDDLGVYKLLFAFENPNLLQTVYPDKLKKVLEYDNAHDATLIPTLEKYLENRGSLNLAAEAMHVHKNTVTYRLNKIKTLLDIDLNKPKNNTILILEINKMDPCIRTRNKKRVWIHGSFTIQ